MIIKIIVIIITWSTLGKKAKRKMINNVVSKGPLVLTYIKRNSSMYVGRPPGRVDLT